TRLRLSSSRQAPFGLSRAPPSCDGRPGGRAMAARLDHLILMVNDQQQSVEFYTRVLGFTHEGQRPPFEVIRVTPDLVIQLAPWGTKGGEHLAFAMSPDEFAATFRRVRE